MSRDKQIEEMVDFFKVILPTKAMASGIPLKITHNYKAYVNSLRKRLPQGFRGCEENC